MRKLRVLILGSTGMLGSALCRILADHVDVYSVSRSTPSGKTFGRNISGIDVRNFARVESIIHDVKPTEIINCIGVIKQRPEGKDPEICIAINSLFPHELSRVAADINARVITFSTDCVFSGKAGHYHDDSIADARDIYGKSKLLGELTEKPGLTIRSSILGPEQNSTLSLFDWFRSNRGGRVQGYKRAIYTGLTTLEMSRLVLFLIQNKPELFGRWNVASEPISKFELLGLINTRMNLGITIDPNEVFSCDRSLDGSRFSKTTGYVAPSWSTMIDDLAQWISEFEATSHAK